ncbi:hydroxyacid dehydrogenase [soil metagenome]
MKTIFFEVQAWEKEKLQTTFPDATLVEEKLSAHNVQNYQDAEIISTFINSVVPKEVIEELPHVKYIATRSTGYDHIDIGYCKSKNILVCNVPEYGSNTVAEHTFALLLSLTRKIYQSVNQSKQLNFDHDAIRGIDLEGKTIGIIGLGKIGQHVLRIAHGFGMNILVVNRSKNEELLKQYNFQYVDLDTALQQSDIITLHLPFNNETKHTITKENITKFKQGSYLINTARGGLIETEAIMIGLDKGILDGVGLDVLEDEKVLSEEISILTSEYKSHTDLRNLVYDHILINHPKVLITPHNAFNSKEALERITKTTIENIHSFLKGTAINAVNSS